jgi:PAS domain S-box-containing protein
MLRGGSEVAGAEAGARASAFELALEALLQTTSDLVWLIDGHGQIVRASPSHAMLLGLDPEVLTGALRCEVIHPSDQDGLVAVVERALGGERQSARIRLTRSLGGWAWVSLDLMPLPAAAPAGRVGEPAVVGTGRLEVMPGEARPGHGVGLFRTLAENVPGVVYLCRNDETYSMLYLNRAARDVTGYPAGEFLAGRRSFVELFHPEDSLGIGPAVEQALAERRPFHLTYRLRHADGGWRWVEEFGQGILSGDGELLFLEGVIFDITKRRSLEAERRALEVQLLQAQKLEGLGLLAGGIAHDFNNLLAGVIGSAELALRRLEAGQPAADLVGRALETARSAVDLTNQLLVYAGHSVVEPKAIDLCAYVRDMQALLSASMPKKVRLEVEHEDPEAWVCGDAAQLRQLVMNLVINASDALGERAGSLRVLTRTATLGAHDASRLVPPLEVRRAARYRVFEVQDDGVGMDEATRRRMFEPFFSTKQKGHGLGLSAVLGIVRGHQGGMEVHSQPGRGTTVRVYLPSVSPPERPEPAPGSGADASAPGACVLLVEDEEVVREVLEEALGELGHRVLSARDGLDGLRVFSEHQGEIDLVLLDMNMPELNGDEVFRLIRARAPGLPVLLSSGYDEASTAQRHAQSPRVGFIRKPYGIEELAQRIRGLLDDPSGAR